MLIYIKNLRGDKTEVQVGESDSVLSIKQQLQALQGHPVDLQKLILAGKILEDTKSAAESGVAEGSTLVLMVSKAKPQAKPSPSNPSSVPQVPQFSQLPQMPPMPSMLPMQPSPQIPMPPMPSMLPMQPSPQIPIPSYQPRMPISTPVPVPLPLPSLPQSNLPVPVQENIEGPSALLTGDTLNSTISMIVDMGFDRKSVEAAMKAAFNNPERAIEYLTSGMPEQQAPPSANLPDNQFRQLMQDPNVMQLLQVIQQNPAALGPILMQLQQSNPDLYNMLMNNRESLMQMIQNPLPNQQINPELIGRLPRPPPGATTINLTPQEQEEVKRLMELGFSKHDALEAYLSCEKNEEMAASLLIENYVPAGASPAFGMPSPDREEEDNP